MKEAFHLGFNVDDVANAKLALMPGDPGRVEKIAATPPLEKCRAIAYQREYCTYLAGINDAPVVVTSTGIGGPSTSIALEELAQMGLRTFLRVGTTGAIQSCINVGDVIIASGAVRMEGASSHYAPLEFPAVAHYQVINALVEAAQSLRIPYHVGVTCSSDTFYPGQERQDTYSGYVLRRFRGITEEWRKLGVLNYEMETAAVLTLCSVMGLQGGSVMGVVVRREECEHVSGAHRQVGEENAVKVAAKAASLLME